MLLKTAGEIRLSDIFQVAEGTFSPVDSISDPMTCPRHKSCVTRDTWTEVQAAVNGVLDSTTLEDLAQRQKVNYPTASCGALREREPPHSKVRMGPLSSPQQAEGYSAVNFINYGNGVLKSCIFSTVDHRASVSR